MRNKTKMILKAIPMLPLFILGVTSTNLLWSVALLVYAITYGYRWSRD